VTGAASAADDRPFELLSATLDGRLTMAIVNEQGAAIAIEIDEEPQIIRGLAAGAILSDLREAAMQQPANDLTVASGATHSEVRVDGAIRVGRATRAETEAVIDGLPNLTDDQRKALKALLAL
jgi:hypothetical protein